MHPLTQETQGRKIDLNRKILSTPSFLFFCCMWFTNTIFLYMWTTGEAQTCKQSSYLMSMDGDKTIWSPPALVTPVKATRVGVGNLKQISLNTAAQCCTNLFRLDCATIR